MVLVQELLPETIKLCRPLIIEEERLRVVARLFTEKWQKVLKMNPSHICSMRTVGRKTEKGDDDQDVHDDRPIVVAKAASETENVRHILRFEGSTIGSGQYSEDLLSYNKRVTDDSHQSTVQEEYLAGQEGESTESELRKSDNEVPLFTPSYISKFPTGKEAGKFLGIGVCEDIIDLAVITTYGDGEYSSISTTCPGTTWRHMPLFVARALADFVQDKEIADINIPGTVSAYTPGMPKDFISLLRAKMADIEILKNVFITNEVISNISSLLIAGRYQNPVTKFALSIGHNIQIALVMKLRNEKGKRRRTIVTVNGNDVLDTAIMRLCTTQLDDAFSFEDLVSAHGMPRLLQSYLIAATKAGIFGKPNVPENLKSPGVITFEHIIDIGRNIGPNDSEDEFKTSYSFLHHLGFKYANKSDCIQAQFITRALVRRSCYILGACAVALGMNFRTKYSSFLISGPMLYFPNYSNYFERVVQELLPPWLDLNIEALGRSGACIGAGLFSTADGIKLVKTEEGRRRLPPFQLKQCCLDCEVCGCKSKWA